MIEGICAGLIFLVCSMELAAEVQAGAPAEDEPAAPQQPPSHPGGDRPGAWHWPLALDLPQSVQDAYPDFRVKEDKAAILVWTPPQLRRIRAILLIMQNTDSMEFGAYETTRQVAARAELGIVYLRFGRFVHDYLKRPERDTKSMQAILDKIAERTGIKEYRHAPWIPFGKSSVGRFPAYLAWEFPDRTLASIVYHGEVPPWSVWTEADWPQRDKQTLLHVNVNGQDEWGGTWYRHVRPGLLNFRAKEGWLPHQVVAWKVSHGNYPEETSGLNDPTPRTSRLRVWDYLALFIEKAMQARLPENTYPTNGPVKLKIIDDAEGYCIDVRAVEELLGSPYKPLVERDGQYVIDPYKSRSPTPDEPPPTARTTDTGPVVRKASSIAPAERKRMFWVPDRQQAIAWLELHAVQE